MKKPAVIEMISISKEWGGIEQHVKDLSDGLIQNGHNVIIVCRDVDLHIRKYSEVGTIRTLPIKNAIDIKTIRGLAKIIKDENIDVVHTHTSRDSWLGLFATWLAGRGKVVTTRHVPLLAKQDFIHTWYFNRLAGIICVSQFVKNKFLGKNPKINTKNVHVIYPGIKIHDKPVVPNIVRSKLGFSADAFVIGFVGRVTMEKGLDDLIEAAALLRQAQQNFKLVLVGDVNPKTPEYIDELQKKAADLGVADCVHFYGFSNDIYSVMHDIDVLVLPSIIPETFGLVLCEAMLAGKPVVTTDTGAQVEIVQDGINGFAVSPGVPAQMAEKLTAFLNNRKLGAEFGVIGKQGVADRFGDKQMLTEFEELLEVLCN